MTDERNIEKCTKYYVLYIYIYLTNSNSLMLTVCHSSSPT